MTLAWLSYNGTRAGLTYWETRHLPVGLVLDQIACWQIANGLADEEAGREEKNQRQKTASELFFGG